MCMQAVTAKQAMLELLTVILGSVRTASARLAAHWDSLVPALLTGFGATLSSTDQAALRLLFILNASRTTQHASAGADGDRHPSNLQAWLAEGVAGIGWALFPQPSLQDLQLSKTSITINSWRSTFRTALIPLRGWVLSDNSQ